jgi:HEAT repeat protein/diketogulonate reductase-like aldo/keto reductase
VISAGLLSVERRARLEAAREVELDPDGIYALRGVLVLDEDAEVRALAAERLGLVQVVRTRGEPSTAVCVALLDALEDPSPMVREHAAIALGRHHEDGAGSSEVLPLVLARLREMTRVEPMWRVRRAVVRALANVARRGAVQTLSEVLGEPFWRVRYAAVQALVAWPDCEAVLRDAPHSPRRDAALAYLHTLWRSGAGCGPEPPETEPGGLRDMPLDDEDPAVVAVRLARLSDEQVEGRRLVELLASPHDVLRRLAIKRLLARARDAELAAAVSLLEEPRTPYASEAARRLLAQSDTSGVRASLLAADDPEPESLAWALESETATGGVGTLATKYLSHRDVRVRRAAAKAATAATDTAALVQALSDPDDTVRAAAVTALAARRKLDGIAAEVLEAHDPSQAPPRVARALVAAFAPRYVPSAGRDRPGDRTLRVLTLAASAWDPATRSAAIGVLARAGALHATERARFTDDPDPWVRVAALEGEDALAALRDDPDPCVRRGAFEALARARREVRDAAIERAASSDDAWLRMHAATAYGRARGGLEAILRLTRDRTPMVRAAAVEALARHPDAAAVCLALVRDGDAMDEELLLAAHARLVQEGTPEAFDALEQDIEHRELSPGARRRLMGMALAYPESLAGGRLASLVSSLAAPAPAAAVTSPPSEAARPRTQALPPVERRSLGKTGIELAPLAISGCFELPLACFARARGAGVNAFFWEPEYRTLSQYLACAERKEDLVVIAGTYEADAATIVRDAERALRRLRCDALGVMLLFWVRSPARLSDETFDALTRLKEAGKVRAVGFSTHLRELAATALAERPWDVVMCRHSAAHPGVESTVLPVARERVVGVITFSALVYSRMLAPDASGQRFDAADCYRYSLTQPGVTVCLSAPRGQRELEENLAVLRAPTLDAAQEQRLRAHGARVRSDNRAFRAFVRRP